MAHFARIEEGIVTQVIVIGNDDIVDAEGNESEAVGQAFIQSLGLDGEWLQTSYNGNFRKNYAGIDYRYDEARNAFIPPQPYPSWVLNETTCLWQAPVARPDDEKLYRWDEPTLSWIEVA